jgi:hypothetical protein
MNAEWLEEKLADYVDGALAPDDRAEVEAALREDPALAEQVAQLRRLRRLIRALPEDEEPPAMLHAVLAATTRKRPGLRDRLPRVSFFFGRLPVAAAALVAIAALGYGIQAFVQSTKLAAPPKAAMLAKAEPTQAPAAWPPAMAPVPPVVEEHLRQMQDMMRQMPPAAGDLAPTGSPGLMPAAAGAANRSRSAGGPLFAASPNERRAVAAKQESAHAVGGPVFGFENPPPPLPGDALANSGRGGAAEQSAVAQQTHAAAAPSAEARKPPAMRAAAILRRWDGNHCAVMRPAVVAATDASAWRRLWQLMHGNMVDKTPAPDVDFDQQTAVAAFMGTKTTGGFATQIVEVRRDGDALAVVVHETTPQPGQLVTEALTQPYSVVLIPREVDGLRIQEDTPIEFLKR